MKSRKGNWGELFDFEDEGFENSLWADNHELDEHGADGIEFLEEAHEALNRLSQKANKRGGLMKQPRRAEGSWQ